MANIDNPNGFKFIYSMLGHGELVEGDRVASGGAIAKGDALIISATVPDVQIAVATSGLLHGVAAQDVATGTTQVPIWYYPALPWNVFEGQCSGTFATTIITTDVDIEGTTGIMEVNENATTEGVIQIIGYDPNSAVGANTRVYFFILRSSWMPFAAAL